MSETIAAFERDGELAVGGVSLALLAERVGGTPFFAYDRGLLDARVRRLRTALPDRVELGYAVKANPMPAVVQHLSGLVDALDVASAGELRTALDTPLAAQRISFAGPGKTASELAQAVAAGAMVELESETEAERVVEVGERLGVRPRVAVRVNPDFQVKGSGMRMGGGAQQFGVDAERVPDLVRRLGAADLELLGLHIFAGSQNLDAETICAAQRSTFDLALRLADEAGLELRYLNVGGGFGIPYHERDSPLDLDAIGANLGQLLDGPAGTRLADARVVVELGRYIVGECGIYVTRIVDKKESRGKVFLVVDGGLHHQLAASGNFGQVIRRNYPVAVAAARPTGAVQTVEVVGCLCTPLDLLASSVELPVAEIGDLIVIFQAGAYGLTASPTAFLGHPEPKEALV